MIGTIRKHSKWLWLIIVTITIFTFVYWGSYTKASRYGRDGGGNLGSIDGVPISQQEFQQASREVFLRYLVQSGQWPDKNPQSGFDARRETYQRLFLLQKVKEYNIAVDSASVAQYADEVLRRFSGGKPVDLDLFVQQVLAQRGINEQNFEGFLQHDLAIQQMLSILGISGRMVTPQEARALYERENREVSTEAVFFSASNFLASVAAPAPGALQQFYSNNAAEYRIPERVQVNYVEFSITGKVAEVEKTLTNLTQMADANFSQLGANYSRFGSSPEAAKAKIRELLLHQEASKIARRDADKVVDDLISMNSHQSSDLALLAKTNGWTLKSTAPFEEQTGPAEFDGGPDFAKTAFSLTSEDPIATQSLVGENAVYVIALNRQIPSEVPSFDSIHDRVLADYKREEALKAAQSAAQTFLSAATNGLAGGKTFAAICAESKVKPVSVPPFSLSSSELPLVQQHVNLGYFKQTVFSTPAGKMAPVIFGNDGAIVVRVKQELPLDTAKMQANMPGFLNGLRRMRQSEAINEWFSKEAPKALSKIPMDPAKKTSSTAASQ